MGIVCIEYPKLYISQRYEGAWLLIHLNINSVSLCNKCSLIGSHPTDPSALIFGDI